MTRAVSMPTAEIRMRQPLHALLHPPECNQKQVRAEPSPACQDFCNISGSLAIFAAILRASSLSEQFGSVQGGVRGLILIRFHLASSKQTLL
jgi:hypothetical protein